MQVMCPIKHAFCLLGLNPRETGFRPHNQSEPPPRPRQVFSETSQHFETRLASRHQGLYPNCISESELRLLSFKESELIQTHIFKSLSLGTFPIFVFTTVFVNPKPFWLYPWLNPIWTIKEIRFTKGKYNKGGTFLQILWKQKRTFA